MFIHIDILENHGIIGSIMELVWIAITKTVFELETGLGGSA